MMKKLSIILLTMGFAIALADLTYGADGCTTIPDKVLKYQPGRYLAGKLLESRYDDYGYNYQAHMFNGSYFNAYANGANYSPYEGDDDEYLEANPGADSHWAWPYRHVTLQMKWSDTWLSNKDCNGDGLLDRGYSCDPDNANNSACPGAWLTNHQSGSDTIDVNGKMKTFHWTSFVKIITPPEDAYKVGDMWFSADGVEIGQAIWGAFAIVQEVYNDPIAGVHGVQYISPSAAGFGYYSPHD